MSSSSEDEDAWDARRARAYLGAQVLPSISGPGDGASSDGESSGTDCSEAGTSSGGVDVSSIVFSSIQWAQEGRAASPTATTSSAQAAASQAFNGPSPNRSPGADQLQQWADSTNATSPAYTKPSSGTLSPAYAKPSSGTPSPAGRQGTPPAASRYTPIITSPTSGQAHDDGVDSPPALSGPSWLSGAAGRLSDLSTPRSRVPLPQQEGLDALGQAAPTPAEVAAQDEALEQHFHDALAAAEDEPLPEATLGITLEECVMGVNMTDLDRLIARLQAGEMLDLSATRPADLPDPSTLFSDSDEDEPKPTAPTAAAAAGPSTSQPSTSAARAQSSGTAKVAAAPAPAKPLPAAAAPAIDAMLAALDAKGQQQGGAQGSAMETMMTALGGKAAGTATAPTPATPAGAAPTGALPPRFKAFPIAPPPGAPPGALPPRFRAFAQPAAADSPPPPTTSTADAPAVGAAAAPARPTVVVDLRASIASSIQAVEVAKKKAAMPNGVVDKPQAGYSIGVGSDEPLPKPVAARSMFVSTADMPPAPAPVAPAATTGAADGNSTAAPAKTRAQPGPAAKAAPTTVPTAPLANGVEGNGSAPHLVSIMLDTEDDWAPVPQTASGGVHARSTPAGAPGLPQEQGTLVVKAGSRIALPPGPVKEPPSMQAEPISTQTADAATDASPPRSPAPPPTPAAPPVQVPVTAAPAKPAPAPALPMQAPAKPAVPSTPVTNPVVQTSSNGQQKASTTALPQTSKQEVASQPVLKAASLPRLPAWLPPAHCLSLAAATPDGLTTCEVASLLQAVLEAATGDCDATAPQLRSAGKAADTKLPALTVAAASLVQLPPHHPLLAGLQPLLQQPAAPASGTSAAQRVLLLACVPGRHATLDGEVQPAGLAGAGAVPEAVSGVQGWLGSAAWGAMTLTGARQDAPGGRQAVWMTCVAGADLLAGLGSEPVPLPAPHPLPATTSAADSKHPGKTIAGGPVPAASKKTSTVSGNAGKQAPPVTSPRDASGEAGDVFVVSLPKGGLQQAGLLAGVLRRAAACGLSLQGLTCAYPPPVTVSYLTAKTPHRAEPHTGVVVVVLAGAAGALARWRAQLGPSDPAVARRTDPTSLLGHLAHALPASALHCAALGCSYDGRGARMELDLFFTGTTAAAPAAPTGPVAAPAPTKAGVDGDTALQVLSPVKLAGSYWLAFPAGTTHECAQALWAVQHLAWCGFAVGSVLRTTTPAARLAGAQLLAISSEFAGKPVGAAAATAGGQRLLPEVVVVAEVRRLEGSQQLQLCLQHMRHMPGATAPAAATTASAVVPFTGPDCLWVCGVTDAQTGAVEAAMQPLVAAVPAVYEVADALAAADKHASCDASDAHASDQLVAVYLQSPGLQTALVLAAEVALQAARQGGDAGSADVEGTVAGAGARVVGVLTGPGAEVVGLRVVRSLPLDCARRLHPLGGAAGGNAAAVSNGEAQPPRLHASQAGVLLLLHGPAAQARAAGAAALWLQLSSSQPVAAAGAQPAAGGCVLEQVMGQQAVRQYLAGSAPPVVSVTQSHSDARVLLAMCFKAGSQVHLDPSFHDGIHRAPPQAALAPATPHAAGSSNGTATGTTAPAPAGAKGDSPGDALVYLLESPHTQDTCLGLLLSPAPADQRDAPKPAAVMASMHRAFRLLHKEQFSVVGALTTCLDAQVAGACLGRPELTGAGVMLMHLRRSNALEHLHQVLHKAGLDGRILIPAPTWAAAQQLLSHAWPTPSSTTTTTQPAGPAMSGASSMQQLVELAGSYLARTSATPASMLQVTCLLLLPGGGQQGGEAAVAGAGGGLQWARASDVISTLQGDGFQLLAAQACRLRPAHSHAISKACSLATQQASALASIAAPARQSAGGNPASHGQRQQIATTAATGADVANVLVLLVQRTNAVAELQLCMQRYTQQQQAVSGGRVAGGQDGAAGAGGAGLAGAGKGLLPWVGVASSSNAATELWAVLTKSD